MRHLVLGLLTNVLYNDLKNFEDDDENLQDDECNGRLSGVDNNNLKLEAN